MLAKKRILLISGWKIFPPETGGHLRSACFAQALARSGHEVRIVSLAARKEHYGLASGPLVEAIEDGLSEITSRSWFMGLCQTLARRLGWPRSWQYYAVKYGRLPRYLRSELIRADIVICDLPYMPLPPLLKQGQLRYLLSHNLEHRLLAQGSGRERRWAPWMKRLEIAAAQTFDAILACAPEDEGFYRSYSGGRGAKVQLVPNGIDPRVYSRAEARRDSVRGSLGLGAEDRLIVFSGSCFEPNLEALAFLQKFCREESAYLEAHRLHFLILGSMREKPSRDGPLIYTGRVPETAPYFAAGDAAINPVMHGSGSNVKIFEYLAARLPVLSTGFGVRGTQLRNEIDFLLFERSELKAALATFLGQRSSSAWKDFSERVWERHKAQCDMQAIAAHALLQLQDDDKTRLSD